jgi:predicted secreted protein
MDPKEKHSMTRLSRAGRASSLLSLLPLVGMAGCSMFGAKAPAAPPAVPVPLVINQPGKSTLTVTEAGNGARVVLERSQTLVVSLEVAGNQNADWVLIALPAGFTVAAGPRFERAVRSPNGDDFSGSTVWHLRAAAPGDYTLSFELRRPRSTQAPFQSVGYTVQVQ